MQICDILVAVWVGLSSLFVPILRYGLRRSAQLHLKDTVLQFAMTKG